MQDECGKMTKNRRLSWRMIVLGFLYLVVCFLLHCSGSATGEQIAGDVPAMYILGDSSVDCGDNTLFYPLLHQNFSLLPCNGSDSSLLPQILGISSSLSPDFIFLATASMFYRISFKPAGLSSSLVIAAGKMGFPYIPPFYGQNGSLEGLLRGLNFGSAQATIINPRWKSYQSLSQQLRQVLDTIQLLQLQVGQETATLFVKSSVFYLSFGKNDYTHLYLQNSYGQYNGEEFATILVDQISYALRSLYYANARKMICMGILPLGCSPRVLADWYDASVDEFDERGCVKKINELVQEFNRLLDVLIIELNNDLPEAQIVYCDVYQGIMEIIDHPSWYGFEETKEACCGVGLNGAKLGCLTMDMSCNRSSGYMWWDLYNPTEAVNSVLADSAWSAQPFSSICHPLTVEDLAASPDK